MEGKRRCRLHGGLSTGPKTPAGRAAVSAANTKHGRYKDWRERQAKERYYRGEIKRLMQEAREAGLVKGVLLFFAIQPAIYTVASGHSVLHPCNP